MAWAVLSMIFRPSFPRRAPPAPPASCENKTGRPFRRRAGCRQEDRKERDAASLFRPPFRGVLVSAVLVLTNLCGAGEGSGQLAARYLTRPGPLFSFSEWCRPRLVSGTFWPPLDGRGLPRLASVILAQRSGSFAISPGKWQAWENKKNFRPPFPQRRAVSDRNARALGV